jgi:hypothetical protein
VTWQEIVIMRLAEGKIVEAVFQANIHEVLEQLGGKIVPPEPTQS